MKKQGFTLIELMIVIAIISILASIIIPNITRAREQAQIGACKENLKAISTGILMYLNDHPETTDVNLPSDIEPDYISKIPVCPADGFEYRGGYCSNSCGVSIIYVHHSVCGTHNNILSQKGYRDNLGYRIIDCPGNGGQGYVDHCDCPADSTFIDI